MTSLEASDPRFTSLGAPVRTVKWADTLDEVAQSHGWWWPVASALVALTGVTVLAFVHRLIDLGTYLMGGAHARAVDLYHVVYPPTHLGFTYPPFAAVLFSPLSHLPTRLDQIVFSWLGVAALITLLVVTLHVTCPSLERRSTLWWALLLVTPIGLLDPVRETFLLGQVNVLLALAVVTDMTMVPTSRRGYLVGLAAAIKLTPLLLVPYLLITRQRGSWLRAVATFVVAEVASALLAPSTSRAYWTHNVWKPNGAGWLPWVGNQGVVGVADRLLGRTISSPLTFTLVALISLIGLVVAAETYRHISPLAGFLVVEATESMASPVSWSHHFIWVVLLIAWLGLAPDRPTLGEWWALVVAVVFWAAPFWWVPHGSNIPFAGRGWLTPLSDSFFLVFAVFVLSTGIWVLRRILHARRAPSL